ncbi:MAG: LptE family protein [Candidatus Aureabacteria bacterium]|nr:LptE family protein [Candidatus Auribacterota bacterium]
MKTILLSLTILCLLTGCGYHLGSVPPAGVTSVYIPMFENLTHKEEITADVTEGIIKRFKTDGTIKITDKENADAILIGKIVDYKTEAVLFNDQDVGEEFRVVITVDVSLVTISDKKTVSSGSGLRGQATTQIVVNQIEAEKRILPDIIKNLSKKVVEVIIESAW